MALFLGINREIAGRYSFLLSIPAILGALVLAVSCYYAWRRYRHWKADAYRRAALLELAGARTAAEVNASVENIGARRLYTIMERLLDEISFSAPEVTLEKLVITTDYVREKLSDVVQDENLSRYIL